ncbi:MAG TPA: NAD(P)-dependent oxidoreductase [Candidatus Lokiarchaeia archaeon]|nr:NAD(P)-dependent oxidoreductase [Candidatus Lokiarchaeia archaeon]
MKQKWVIIGASGFVGVALLHNLQGQYDLVGTYNKHPLDSDVIAVPLDITDYDQVHDFIDREQPSGVLMTAAISDPNEVLADPDRAQAINVTGPTIVAANCEMHGIPLIHFSTDYVFNIPDELIYVKEDDTEHMHPINEYGRQKLAAEQEVRTACPNATILRIAIVYGWRYSQFARSNFVLNVLRALQEGREIACYTDQYGTPTYLGDIVTFIPLLMDAIFAGTAVGETYHLAGRQVISRYDLALEVAQVFELEDRISLIRPALREETATTALRAYNSALDSSKIQQIFGFTPCSPAEGLAMMREEDLGGDPSIF